MGDVVRERATGQGPRLLRGEENKDFDTGVSLQKEVKKNDVKDQKEQTVKNASTRALVESRVILCQNCARLFEQSGSEQGDRERIHRFQSINRYVRSMRECCLS